LSDEVLVWLGLTCLEQGAYCLHMVAIAIPKPHNPLPHLKIQTGFTFVEPAYPGCPGKEVIK